jgi:hypothetical protein
MSGALDCGLTVFASDHPSSFDSIWAALGRALLSGLVAWGLWNRLAVSRSLALVYCIGSVLTYSVALLLALLHEPLHFPSSIVVGSAFEVPSCVLLFGYLRTPEASALFGRTLF